MAPQCGPLLHMDILRIILKEGSREIVFVSRGIANTLCGWLDH
jgi:hypothetical protein